MTERMYIVLNKVDDFLKSSEKEDLRIELSSAEKSIVENHIKESHSGKAKILMGVFKPGFLRHPYYISKK